MSLSKPALLIGCSEIASETRLTCALLHTALSVRQNGLERKVCDSVSEVNQSLIGESCLHG